MHSSSSYPTFQLRKFITKKKKKKQKGNPSMKKRFFFLSFNFSLIYCIEFFFFFAIVKNFIKMKQKKKKTNEKYFFLIILFFFIFHLKKRKQEKKAIQVEIRKKKRILKNQECLKKLCDVMIGKEKYVKNLNLSVCSFFFFEAQFSSLANRKNCLDLVYFKLLV